MLGVAVERVVSPALPRVGRSDGRWDGRAAHADADGEGLGMLEDDFPIHLTQQGVSQLSSQIMADFPAEMNI